MNTDTKTKKSTHSECSLCKKIYRIETLIRNGGTCHRCQKKQTSVKSECKICKKIYLTETLLKRDGKCSACYNYEENTKRVNCKGCDKEFFNVALKKHEGLCTVCSQKHDSTIQANCLKCDKLFAKNILRQYSGLCPGCNYKKTEGKSIISSPLLLPIISKDNENNIQNDIQNDIIKLKLDPIKYERLRENICAICLDSFKDTDDIVILPACKHYFHHTCIQTYFAELDSKNKSQECPLCRMQN